MKTKNGIELDIKKSNYKYHFEGITFYFSSEFYLTKFKTNVNFFISTETIKLYNKYKILSNFRIFLSISYYKKIEKRGFYIIGNDGMEIKENAVIEDIY